MTAAKRVLRYLKGTSTLGLTYQRDQGGPMLVYTDAYHYVREAMEDRTIDLRYCPTKEMVADPLTKPLPRALFLDLREMMGRADVTMTFGHAGEDSQPAVS